MKPKAGSGRRSAVAGGRSRIEVLCIFCGARLGRVTGDYERVVGTCRTCVYRVGQGENRGEATA